MKDGSTTRCWIPTDMGLRAAHHPDPKDEPPTPGQISDEDWQMMAFGPSGWLREADR